MFNIKCLFHFDTFGIILSDRNYQRLWGEHISFEKRKKSWRIDIFFGMYMHIFHITRNAKSKDKFTLPYQVIIYTHYEHSKTDHLCIFAIFLYWLISFISFMLEGISTYNSSQKRYLVLLDISRNYSNCMFYFHILAYNRGTSEAHFVAKWQHLLHSYQYNVCHIVWIN